MRLYGQPDPAVTVLSSGPSHYISNLKLALSEQLPSIKIEQLVTENQATSLLLRMAGLGLVKDWLQQHDDANSVESTLIEALPPYHRNKYFS